MRDKLQSSGDPSKNIQSFTDVKLNLLNCRYWKLELWDCHDMAFPFWRIYWNKNSGGVMRHNFMTYDMSPDKVYVVAPFTSFSTKYVKNHFHKKGIHVAGSQVNKHDNETTVQRSLLHLFIHFKLGIPFDNVFPGIFEIKMTPYLLINLEYLTNRLKTENRKFYATYTLKLQSIVNDILSNIGPELFKTLNVDHRILNVIRHIENYIEGKPTNSDLAAIANMAPNSFSRLFKQKMNMTLHNYIMKRKIAQSCDLFLHTNQSISEVAHNIGFSDRFHFSRVFKMITGSSPAVYKSFKAVLK